MDYTTYLTLPTRPSTYLHQHPKLRRPAGLNDNIKNLMQCDMILPMAWHAQQVSVFIAQRVRCIDYIAPPACGIFISCLLAIGILLIPG